MITGSVGRRYAKALAMIAGERDMWNEIFDDLKILSEVWDSPQLQRFIKEPGFTRKEKAKIIKELGKSLGLGEITLNFLNLLALKGRLEFLKDVVREFERMFEERKRIVRVIVKTPFKLSEETKGKIEEVIRKKSGRNPVIFEDIDESLIGGVKIIVEGKIFDGSARRMIEKLLESS